MTLFKSRKFWLAISDAVISTLSIMLTWWLSPDKVQQVMIVIGIWQPVIVAVIIGIAVEDAATIKAGVTLTQVKDQSPEAAAAATSRPTLQ